MSAQHPATLGSEQPEICVDATEVKTQAAAPRTDTPVQVETETESKTNIQEQPMHSSTVVESTGQQETRAPDKSPPAKKRRVESSDKQEIELGAPQQSADEMIPYEWENPQQKAVSARAQAYAEQREKEFQRGNRYRQYRTGNYRTGARGNSGWRNFTGGPQLRNSFMGRPTSVTSAPTYGIGGNRGSGFQWQDSHSMHADASGAHQQTSNRSAAPSGATQAVTGQSTGPPPPVDRNAASDLHMSGPPPPNTNVASGLVVSGVGVAKTYDEAMQMYGPTTFNYGQLQTEVSSTHRPWRPHSSQATHLSYGQSERSSATHRSVQDWEKLTEGTNRMSATEALHFQQQYHNEIPSLVQLVPALAWQYWAGHDSLYPGEQYTALFNVSESGIALGIRDSTMLDALTFGNYCSSKARMEQELAVEFSQSSTCVSEILFVATADCEALMNAPFRRGVTRSFHPYADALMHVCNAITGLPKGHINAVAVRATPHERPNRNAWPMHPLTHNHDVAHRGTGGDLVIFFCPKSLDCLSAACDTVFKIMFDWTDQIWEMGSAQPRSSVQPYAVTCPSESILATFGYSGRITSRQRWTLLSDGAAVESGIMVEALHLKHGGLDMYSPQPASQMKPCDVLKKWNLPWGSHHVQGPLLQQPPIAAGSAHSSAHPTGMDIGVGSAHSSAHSGAHRSSVRNPIGVCRVSQQSSVRGSAHSSTASHSGTSSAARHLREMTLQNNTFALGQSSTDGSANGSATATSNIEAVNHTSAGVATTEDSEVDNDDDDSVIDLTGKNA